MKRAEHRPESGMRDRWMVSYIDVLTILLIFFVAVAAKSLTPPPKKTPPPPTPVVVPQPVRHPPLEDVREKMIERGLDPRLELNMDSRGLIISLPQTILFRPGRDKVESAALPVVDGIAQALEHIPNKISVIGHADPVPIHNRRFRNNWELAAARGLRVLELLTTRGRIPEARVSTASYGSTEPRSSNYTPGGRAGNRRVEILVMESEP